MSRHSAHSKASPGNSKTTPRTVWLCCKWACNETVHSATIFSPLISISLNLWWGLKYGSRVSFIPDRAELSWPFHHIPVRHFKWDTSFLTLEFTGTCSCIFICHLWLSIALKWKDLLALFYEGQTEKSEQKSSQGISCMPGSVSVYILVVLWVPGSGFKELVTIVILSADLDFLPVLTDHLVMTLG